MVKKNFRRPIKIPRETRTTPGNCVCANTSRFFQVQRRKYRVILLICETRNQSTCTEVTFVRVAKYSAAPQRGVNGDLVCGEAA